jgi:hypothetical protein
MARDRDEYDTINEAGLDAWAGGKIRKLVLRPLMKALTKRAVRNFVGATKMDTVLADRTKRKDAVIAARKAAAAKASKPQWRGGAGRALRNLNVNPIDQRVAPPAPGPAKPSKFGLDKISSNDDYQEKKKQAFGNLVRNPAPAAAAPAAKKPNARRNLKPKNPIPVSTQNRVQPPGDPKAKAVGNHKRPRLKLVKGSQPKPD